MASSPRTGRSSAAMTAVGIGAILLIGAAAVVLLSGGDPVGLSQRVVESLYPPEAVTSQGRAIRELYTIVFLIAVVIFFVVEALIVWTVVRYRRKPGEETLPRRPTATPSPRSCGPSSRRSSSRSCSSCRGRP